MTNLTQRQIKLYNLIESVTDKLDTVFLYSHLVYHVETLYNLLERISNAITFAQHGMFHYSIIQHDVLLDALKYVPKNQLITDNLLMLSAYLEVQLYKLSNEYYFIIALPLVEEVNYEYLDLTPIVQPYENSLCTFPISQHRQLLRHEDIFEAVDCIKAEDYICTKQSITLSICERNILKFEEQSCNLTIVNCPTNHWTEISNNIYLIYSPTIENIEVNCKDGMKQTSVKGAVLIRNNGCKIKFKEHIMESIETSGEILRIPEFIIPKIENLKPIYISNDSNHMHQQIQHLRDLQEIRERPNLTLSYNITLTILITITALSIVIWLKCRNRKNLKIQEKSEAAPTVNIEMTTLEKAPASTSSIFPRSEGILPVPGKKS